MNFSEETPVVHVFLLHKLELPDDYINYWESFAKNFTSKGEKEKVVIHQRNGQRSPYYRQPWLEFMDTFHYYFL